MWCSGWAHRRKNATDTRLNIISEEDDQLHPFHCSSCVLIVCAEAFPDQHWQLDCSGRINLTSIVLSTSHLSKPSSP